MNWKEAALVVIDMENAFISDKSPLCIRQAAATIPACGDAIRKARARGMAVFFVNRVYRKNGSDVEFTRYASWESGGRYLAPSSKGALSIEVPQEFQPQAGDYTLIKPRFSAFFQTELDLLLRRLGIKTLFLAGTTTPNCIRTTCYDGLSLDYNIAILADCTSSNTAEIQRVNLEDMERVGAILVSNPEFLDEGFQMQNLAGEICARVRQDASAPE